MNRYLHSLLVSLFAIIILFSFYDSKAQQPDSPESWFGFQPGADCELFDYEEMIGYFDYLAEHSGLLEMRQIGESPMGKPMYIAFISSEENIKKLDELAKINAQLALNPELEENELDQMAKNGRVFFLATLSMHSSEVGPSQSAPLIAWDLITTEDPEKLKWLDNVVYMLNPSHNPDGMNMIVEHYRKYKGTKYEDSNMPGVYHKYVGHDNNRDFITLSQSDTKAISDLTSKTWFPQVMVEKHQMGRSGVRYFVPPNHDPIADNVDAGLWNWNGIFGTNMIKDLTRKGCSGVAQHYLFDNYWPGSTETCLWKNVMAFLTEAASCNYATPVYIEPNELGAWGKGLAEYKKSTNMPDPWAGGWWRLGDIVKYEIVSTESILKTCSDNREEILRFRNDICKKEVEKGKNEAPYFYIMPAEQHDRSEWIDFARLMTEHGVVVNKLTQNVEIENKNYEAGAFVVSLAQPFRPFIKEVMEAQEYPVRHYTPDGEIIKPYDIATWSLPLHKGVSSDEINTPQPKLENLLAPWNPEQERALRLPENTSAVLLGATDNASYDLAFRSMGNGLKTYRLAEPSGDYAEGSFVVSIDGGPEGKIMNSLLKDFTGLPLFLSTTEQLKLVRQEMPRIALMESWFHDMDAGWTRYVFDSYGINYRVLHPGDIEETDLEKDFDVLVFPNEDKDVLLKGKYKSGEGVYSPTSYPPDYTKGIGEKGMKKIMGFVDQGGKVVSWGESTALFIGPLKISGEDDEAEEFVLPVRDQAKSLQSKGLYCPGSLVEIHLKPGHPLTLGMPGKTGVFYRGEPVFATREPHFDMDRRVIATFPEKDILLSGYIEKEELLARKTVMAWIRKGEGQLVLFAFNPQFRASTPATYKLLFNALLMPEPEKMIK